MFLTPPVSKPQQPTLSPPAMHLAQQAVPADIYSQRNAIVLVWENVLAPIKWMERNVGLRMTRVGLDQATRCVAANAYVKTALAAIEDQMFQLLHACAARGPVFIVSDDTSATVEATCRAFFPRLAHCLSLPHHTGVQVICAQQKITTPAERATWKVRALQNICSQRVFGGVAVGSHVLHRTDTGSFSLLLVTALDADRVACGKTCDVAPFVRPKCIRVRSLSPMGTLLSLEEFFLQQKRLTAVVGDAAGSNQGFSVRL